MIPGLGNIIAITGARTVNNAAKGGMIMAPTKKVVAKEAPKTRRRKTDKDDGVYWVISQRELVTWKPFALFKTEDTARAACATYESQANTAYRKYKVDRVQLLDPAAPVV